MCTHKNPGQRLIDWVLFSAPLWEKPRLAKIFMYLPRPATPLQLHPVCQERLEVGEHGRKWEAIQGWGSVGYRGSQLSRGTPQTASWTGQHSVQGWASEQGLATGGLRGKARGAEERLAQHQEGLKVEFAHPFMLLFSQNLSSIYHGTARNKTEPYPPGADIPAGRWAMHSYMTAGKGR